VEPQPGQEKPHLPPPSLWPIGFAIGVVCILVGLIVSWPAAAVGVVLTVIFGFLWVRDVTTGYRRRDVGVEPGVGGPESATEGAPAIPADRGEAAMPPPERGETFSRNVFLEGATLGLGGVITGIVTANRRLTPSAVLNRSRFASSKRASSCRVRTNARMTRTPASVSRMTWLIRSSFTWEPGTWVEEEDETMERAIISAITHDSTEAKVTVSGVPDRPGVAARLFRALADRAVNVDMIEQNVATAGHTDISFTVPKGDLAASIEVAESVAPEIGAERVTADPDIARVSLVGAGMKTNPGVAATMFETLAGAGINIEMISTSTIRISCVVRGDAVDRAVQVLHDVFELDANA